MDPILAGAIGAIIGMAAGAGVFALIDYLRTKKDDKNIKDRIDKAQTKANMIVKNAEIDGKQLINELKMQAENDIKLRKVEIIDLNNKLAQREDNLDKRDIALLNKETMMEEKNENLNRQLAENQKRGVVLQEKIDSILEELQKVAHLSIKEAHDEIMARVESKMDREISQYMKSRDEEAMEEADLKASDLIALAITRHAQEIVIDKTTSTISLPSDEMKGRIIGREGRNIKSLEQLLGVDILIDDTPEAITISCFNPVRREIAKRTLEILIADGRIQPGRIEEIVEKVKTEINQSIISSGQDALFKLGLPKMPREEVELLGTLKYRTSYGQNALEHSMEVAQLAGVMAAELGLNETLAKRAGLLHDIGKAMDFEVEGTHVEIGARIAKKFNENEVIINSIESHHGDVPQKSIISILVQAADTLSAARPGARRETVEKYIKRIEQLENITKSFDGVFQSYAIQSGREIRVMVLPDKIDDVAAYKMARDIKEKIETEMNYPGQIKVSVIREYRAVETAK
ncbi:MAG: ribonuclease Y [Bacilli bacterium]